MKAITFLIITVSFLASCSKNNEYNIQGSFIGEPTEEWIYLVKYGVTNPQIDSARIENEKFVFKGLVDFPEIYALHYHRSRSQGILPFFLEPANLDININLKSWDFGSKISGGKVNEEYENVFFNNFKNEIMELQKNPANSNENKKEAINIKLAELGKADYDYKLDYINKNPDSPISIYLFLFMSWDFSTDELGIMLSKFSPTIQETSIFQSINDEYNEKIRPEESTPALTFNNEIKLINADLKDVPIIETLLKENPGKNLYIDVWGTWCTPCIKEFPASRELVKKMKSTDIAFVYLCLDSEENEWKEMLYNEELKGQHFLVEKKQLNRLLEETGAWGGGVPHYFIVDRNGDIINNKAPKPSSDKIEKLLSGL